MTEDRDHVKQRMLFRSVRFVSARTVTGSLSVLASLLLYRALGPEEAGRFQFVLAAGMTLGVLAGMGFFETLSRFVPERAPREGNGLFRRALQWNLAVGVLFGVLLWGVVRATGFPRDAAQAGFLLPLFHTRQECSLCMESIIVAALMVIPVRFNRNSILRRYVNATIHVKM